MIWAFFVAIVLLLARLFGGPLVTHYAPGQQDNAERLITSALIVALAFVIDRVIRRFYWEGHLKKRRNRETPKLIQDIVTVFLVALAITFALWLQEGLSLAGIMWLIGRRHAANQREHDSLALIGEHKH